MQAPPNYTLPKYAHPAIDCACNGYYHGDCKTKRRRLTLEHVHGLLFDLAGVVYCAKCGDALPNVEIRRDDYGNVTYGPKQ